MRKLFYSLLCLAFFSAHSSYAQSVINGGFEYWSPVNLFEVPDVSPPTSEILSSNNESFRDNKLTMTKIPGPEGNAMHLETMEINNGQDTVSGFFIWGGDPGGTNPPVFKGGFPFSDQNVTSLKADLRYSINMNSPGVILVQFKKNGVPIGGGNTPAQVPGLYVFYVAGKQSTFTTMDFPIVPALTEAPDSAAIVFTSNNVFDETNPTYPGDFIDVDNVRFEGTTLGVPGGNLNNWIMLPPVELPYNWNVMVDDRDMRDLRSTDAVEGNNSLHLISRHDPEHNEKRVAAATLGIVDSFEGGTNFFGGMQVTAKPSMMSLSYRMTGNQADTASVRAIFLHYNTTTGLREEVGNAHIRLPLNSDWNEVGVIVNYNNAMPDPDSLVFEITGASWNNENPFAEFWVDDIRLHYCDDMISIMGPASVCSNAMGVEYTADESWPGSSFYWTVPAGAVITAGQGTDKISVNFGNTFGQVTVTQMYSDGCIDDFAMLDVTQAFMVTASANAPQYACTGYPIQLEGFFSGAAGATWSSTGDGTFTDVNDMFAQYHPGPNEIAGGSATVMLRTYGGGNCGEASDLATTYIVPRPAPDAGASFAVCETETTINLSGSTGDPNAAIGWSSSGDGTMTDPNSLNASYTLGTVDLVTDYIAFILYAYNIGCMEEDQVTVFRQAAPTAYAGPDQTICVGDDVQLSGEVTETSSITWTTSGSGSFQNPSSLNAVYNPSLAEETAGLTTIRIEATGFAGCSAVIDEMQVIISVCTGNSVDKEDNLKVYPNPASGVLYVETNGSYTAESITLMDQYSKTLITAKGTGSFTTIDISGIPSGVYFLVTSGNDIQKTEKIVIE